MPDYLQPSDGPSRIEKFLKEMKGLFRELATQQEALKSDMVKIKADNADQAALRKVQDEMRVYVDTKTEGGIERGIRALEDKVGLARSSILTETEKMIITRLNEWADERLQPMLDAILEAREAAARDRRSSAIKQWRERAAFATTIVVLLWAIFDPFGASDNARETGRIGGAIEMFNDAVN